VAARISRLPVLLLAVFVYVLAFGARLPIAMTRRLDGDEAVQGIAALRLIDHGDWTWFFPGQHYAGMLETIPQGLFQLIDRGSVFLLRLPLVMAAAGAVVMLAFLALELTRSRVTFLAVGSLAAVFPPVYVLLGSWQTAGYNTATLLGVTAAYLFACGLRPALAERRRVLLLAAAGLSAGLAVYEQPIAVFVMAALATTIVVATWPRAVDAFRWRYLLVFAAPAALGASPQIVELFSGLGSSTANNPLPPDYHLSPSLGLAVAGLNVFGDPASLPVIGSTDGYESMGWNLVGIQRLEDELAPEAMAVALALGVWAWIAITLGRAYRSRRGMGEADPDLGRSVRLRIAVAAGALAGTLVMALAILRLPPWSKYGFGLAGFAAFGLGIVATHLGTSRAIRALVALGIAALVGLSIYSTVDDARESAAKPVHAERSWLLDRIRATYQSDGAKPVIFGDYWSVYPLQFMSGDRLAGSVAEFSRFPDAGGDGEAPPGRVLVPVMPNLAFTPEVNVILSQSCTVDSTRSHGEAKLLVAHCR
jgi:hypothetical protein